MKKEYDMFISYACEDKAAVAAPLAEGLRAKGFRVWFDEFEICPGDGLRRSIETGIGNSEYGIVIFSKDFFRKGWTNYELDGLVAMNMEAPGRLLPIWHNVSRKEVAEYSLPLSNILAINADEMTVAQIIQKLISKLGKYHYMVDEDGNIARPMAKVNVPVSDIEAGYQVIKSINTDELIDKTVCICTNEAIIYPYKNICEYNFNYWQARKGEINVITHMAYDCNTGKIISDGHTVVENDGYRLLSTVHFNRISDGPVKIICKISASNLHAGLFTEGFSDMGFNHNRNIDFFAYYLVMPDKEDFKHIRLYAGNEECRMNDIAGKKEIMHVVRNIRNMTETQYRIINTGL